MFQFKYVCAFVLFFSFSFTNASQHKKNLGFLVILKEKPILTQFSLNVEKLQKIKKVLDDFRPVVESFDFKILSTYSHAFVGFYIEGEEKNITLLAQNPQIKNISKNIMISLNDSNLSLRSWGLDRVDQRDLPLDDIFDISQKGTGSHVYVIDSGLNLDHSDFLKIGKGYSSIGDASDFSDCIGHGTHVAGTIAGQSAGIAVDTTVHPVRVFECDNSTTLNAIIQGVEWVIKNQESPAVINMSLGGGANAALDEAAQNAVNANITVVVAAGNSNQDACNYSPARVDDAITVGATKNDDTRASFSNFGNCIDIFAPGQGIVSASHESVDGFTSMSGTSMASPHVAGVATLYLGLNPRLSPAQVFSKILANASTDKIKDAGLDSPNLMLYAEIQGSSNLVVDAGEDLVRRIPNNHVVLTGKIVSQHTGVIKYGWRQVSKNSNVIKTSFTAETDLVLHNLPIGEYTFEFWAETSQQSAKDQVTVVISEDNMAPYVDAGEDMIVELPVNEVILKGKCIDEDGFCKEIFWTQKNNLSSLAIEAEKTTYTTLRLRDLQVGQYVFTLTGVDSEGKSSTDSVVLTVR